MTQERTSTLPERLVGCDGSSKCEIRLACRKTRETVEIMGVDGRTKSDYCKVCEMDIWIGRAIGHPADH